VIIEKKISNSEQYEIKYKIDKLQWCRVLEMAKHVPLVDFIMNSLKETPVIQLATPQFCGQIGEIKLINISLTDNIFIRLIFNIEMLSSLYFKIIL
jgi:hypothetical protein